MARKPEHENVHDFPAWLQMARAYNYVKAHVSVDLRRAGLTLARFEVLVVLEKVGPMSQQTLADHLLVTKGNVVGLIDKLSVRGLVERYSSDSDGRVNLLRVTSAGRKLVDRTLPRQMQLIASLMRTLSRREAAALEQMLSRLHDQATPKHS